MMVNIKEIFDKFKMPILFVVAVLAVAFYLLTRTTTVSNMYCGICHFKEAELVKTSFSHNYRNSKCVDCHDTSYLSISKHFDSAPDFINAKCVKCHNTIQQEKEIKGRKIVKMSHLAHNDGKKTKMKCVECHITVAHDTSSYSTNRPTMVSCFTGDCHTKEKDLKKCDYCHYVKLVFPEDKK